MVEPAVAGDPAKVAALAKIPQLVVYGDFIDKDSRWPTIRRNGLAFVEQVRAAGGQVDVIDLPEHGIRGNCHMMMQDRTNDRVAGVIQDWLVSKGMAKA